MSGYLGSVCWMKFNIPIRVFLKTRCRVLLSSFNHTCRGERDWMRQGLVETSPFFVYCIHFKNLIFLQIIKDSAPQFFIKNCKPSTHRFDLKYY
jgi:hypothetical protein